MIHTSLFFTNGVHRASLRPVHGFAAAVAVVSALSALAGCTTHAGGGDGGDGGGSGTSSGDACRGSAESVVYSERLTSSGGSLQAQCLPVTLFVNQYFEAPCAVIEARAVGAAAAASCNQCSGAGRAKVSTIRQPMVDRIQAENPSAALDCFCEIEQVTPGQQDWPSPPCQYDPASAPVASNGQPVDGFCYVDPGRGLGDDSLVQACPQDEMRILRFVGAGVPVPGSEVYATCVTGQVHPASADCAAD